MTPEELNAIEDRVNDASPGPWHTKGAGGLYMDGTSPSAEVVIPDPPYRLHNPYWTHGDAEFVAHARSDVPALVAEVRRLGTMLTQVQELAAWLEDCAVHAYQQSCTRPTTANGYSYACRAYTDAAERLRDIVGTKEGTQHG